ncbi:MAG: Gfo/Idh/MocA family oxidoreductase [Saprospiraceae bacterium]|nr:Gfo/Idh/MocA family oxidoreductase [Saprospiraceae bacterium]|tara:strand:- start:1802 stop:3124 length:1323 start_codon:yes stop_codon:yes gene_type:complete
MDLNLSSRRDFVKKTGTAAVIAPFAINSLTASPFRQNMNTDTLRVGLIGCGGRGTGAALQAINADDNVILVAMADVFQDRLDKAYTSLQDAMSEEEIDPKKMAVMPDHKFIGFDAYQKLIDSDVDVVLLATPPCFRPGHLAAAVEAGKHVFCEKPVAVDAPGVRSVIATANKAKEKGLALMSGFCWRHDIPKIETYNRLLDGGIGDMHTLYTTYNTGALWFHERKEGWSDFEFEMRNWLYQNWMSGDHIAEQAIHSLDLMAWAMGDVNPVSVSGTGGRQSRTEDQFGNVFDHFALVYDYGEGRRGYHFSRQQKGTSRAYTVDCMGNDGRAFIDVFKTHEIKGKTNWEYSTEEPWKNMYQLEHNTLFKSIRDGDPFHDGVRMANSTMLAVMGRLAAYTGQTLTWDEAINSNEILGPTLDQYNWDLKWPMADVAKPGITKFA